MHAGPFIVCFVPCAAQRLCPEDLYKSIAMVIRALRHWEARFCSRLGLS